MNPIYCDECGYGYLDEVGSKDNTRLFVCPECHSQQAQWVKGKTCKHEYDARSGDKCIHCGVPNIHLK